MTSAPDMPPPVPPPVTPPPQPHHGARLPAWLHVPYRGAKVRAEVRRVLSELDLHTVCESARCPNWCSCWASRTATFLILGNCCTRRCAFCAVAHGRGQPVSPDEPERVAQAAQRLELRFVVVTSVTRDDLADGGAHQFAVTVGAVKRARPDTGVEVLTPDFQGREADVATVIESSPEVFSHNLETCARLSRLVRPQADYGRSLRVLANAMRRAGPRTALKSGVMLGLGETRDEIRTVLQDLRATGVSILTMGQYMAPSPRHWPVARFLPPEEFAHWGQVARAEFGFACVVSQPLARSSYAAAEAFAAWLAQNRQVARCSHVPCSSPVSGQDAGRNIEFS